SRACCSDHLAPCPNVVSETRIIVVITWTDFRIENINQYLSSFKRLRILILQKRTLLSRLTTSRSSSSSLFFSASLKRLNVAIAACASVGRLRRTHARQSWS